MPIYEWLVLIFSIGVMGGSLCHLHRKNRQLEKLQKAYQEAMLKIHRLEQDQSPKKDRRKNTEEKLRSYLQLMDALINAMPNPICFKDLQGVLQGCNQVFASNILGLTRDRIIGKHSRELPNQISPDLKNILQRQDMLVQEKSDVCSFEDQVQCADGVKRDFLFNMAPIKNHKGEFIGSMVVMSDLTDKNRAASDRFLKERIEGALETAGGVCHEFNQPLQALSGYLEILAVKINTPSEALFYMNKALEQIERMGKITEKLQAITCYATKVYAGNSKIIDISKSSKQ